MTTPEKIPLTFSQRQEDALKRYAESPAALLDIQSFFSDLESGPLDEGYEQPLFLDYDSRAEPRASTVAHKALLERRKNHLICVTPWGFTYEKIRHEEPENSDWTILRLYLRTNTEILVEGMVFIDRKAYWITQEDLVKGVIRRSRQLNLLSRPLTVEDFKNGTATRKSAAASTAVAGPSLVQLGEQGNPGIEIEAEEFDVADRLLSEQINSLLDS